MTSSTCYESEGSSSNSRLHLQVWYSVFVMQQLAL